MTAEYVYECYELDDEDYGGMCFCEGCMTEVEFVNHKALCDDCEEHRQIERKMTRVLKELLQKQAQK